MFENFRKLFKKGNKREALSTSSKETAKERLHLVLMQDRANVSADFLDLMREEIIAVIKKYIDVDEKSMDVRLTNQENEDGTQGAPILYANIPIVNIREESKLVKKEIQKKENMAKKEEAIKEEKDEVKEQEENKKIEEAKKIVEEESKIEEKREEIKEEKDEVKEENKEIEETKIESDKTDKNETEEKRVENKVSN